MQPYFFIRVPGKYVRLDIRDILYAEGCKNYTRIVTENRSYVVLITMKRVELLLPAPQFCRIHKSYIVAIGHILEFDASTVYLKNKLLPIGDQYKGLLEKRVQIANMELLRVLTDYDVR